MLHMVHQAQASIAALSSWTLTAAGAAALTVADQLPGENGLLRLGLVAAAVTALTIAFVRVMRILSAIKDAVDDFVELRSDAPMVERRLARIEKALGIEDL